MCSFGSCKTRFEFLSQFGKVRNAFECFVTQVQTRLPKTKRVWPMKTNVICTVCTTQYNIYGTISIRFIISHYRLSWERLGRGRSRPKSAPLESTYTVGYNIVHGGYINCTTLELVSGANKQYIANQTHHLRVSGHSRL